MIRIVALGGTGDVYLLSALFEAFQRQHNREATLVIREKYRCIAEFFGPAIRYVYGDDEIDRAEQDVTFQRDYDNVFAEGRDFFAHPSFFRTPMRVDHLTTKPDVSQADMYKIILRLPPNVPLALPCNLPAEPMVPNRVIIVPEARSWPNLHPDFWEELCRKLPYAGWNVQSNLHSGWTLHELFVKCATAEWVIGPQCGVMSILVTGRFRCRKTLATSDVDGRWLFSQRSFPYAAVTKFSNADYDVEEFKIGDASIRDLVDVIVNGANARRLWAHDPAPVTTVTMPLTPGDFLDRFAVLTVKRSRFDAGRRAAIEREFQRHCEASLDIIGLPGARELFDKLVDVHARAFDVLETAVPQVLADELMGIEAHIEAIKLNRERVRLKQEIDAALHAGGSEVKSYYPPDG